MLNDDKVLENVRLAAGCGASPTMLLTVALASMGDGSMDSAFDRLVRLRDPISRIAHDTPRPHARLAELEPELESDPPIARMRLDVADHELRGRLVFKDLLSKQSFMQVAALAIAGIELSESDAQLLDHEGALTQLSDPRIWPLTVTRRIAVNGGTLAESVVAGLATLCTEQMTVLPVAGFMRYLGRVESHVRGGCSVEQAVAATLDQGERVPGIGRPVLKADERVPPMLELARRFGRADGPSMALALQIDAVVAERKALRVNSAGFQGALLRDMGFSPDAAAAFCLIYFLVPLLTHAASAVDGQIAATTVVNGLP
jgi:hypothetical protein